MKRKIIIIVGILIASILLIGCSPDIQDNTIKRMYKDAENNRKTIETTQKELDKLEVDLEKIESETNGPFTKYTKYQLKHEDPFKRKVVIILDQKDGYVKYMEKEYEQYIDTKHEYRFSDSMEKSIFLKKYEINKE